MVDAVELHCRLEIRGQTRFRLPDVAVVKDDRSPDDRCLNGAPDLVAEIRSPEDSVAALLRKVQEYFANAAALAWFVLPEEQSALVCSPEGRVEARTAGETLDGGALLPDLRIAIDELFS